VRPRWRRVPFAPLAGLLANLRGLVASHRRTAMALRRDVDCGADRGGLKLARAVVLESTAAEIETMIAEYERRAGWSWWRRCFGGWWGRR
jgi:hypothetical protein